VIYAQTKYNLLKLIPPTQKTRGPPESGIDGTTWSPRPLGYASFHLPRRNRLTQTHNNNKKIIINWTAKGTGAVHRRDDMHPVNTEFLFAGPASRDLLPIIISCTRWGTRRKTVSALSHPQIHFFYFLLIHQKYHNAHDYFDLLCLNQSKILYHPLTNMQTFSSRINLFYFDSI
jgi:hypothetical protein